MSTRNPFVTIDHGLKLLDLSSRVLRGDLTSMPDLVRELVALGLDLAPEEELRAALDEKSRARVNAIADIAERAKFGP